MMLDGGIGGRDDPIFASLTDLFNEEKARHDAEEDQREGFDGRGVTMGHTPNPLPCGCGAKGTSRINVEGTRIEYDNIHVSLCPLHEAAGTLLESLEVAVKAHSDFALEPWVDDARAAIAKAKGGKSNGNRSRSETGTTRC